MTPGDWFSDCGGRKGLVMVGSTYIQQEICAGYSFSEARALYIASIYVNGCI